MNACTNTIFFPNGIETTEREIGSNMLVFQEVLAKWDLVETFDIDLAASTETCISSH